MTDRQTDMQAGRQTERSKERKKENIGALCERSRLRMGSL